MRQQFSVFTALFHELDLKGQRIRLLRLCCLGAAPHLHRTPLRPVQAQEKSGYGLGSWRKLSGLGIRAHGQTTQGNGYLRVYVGYEDLRLLCRVDHILAI